MTDKLLETETDNEKRQTEETQDEFQHVMESRWRYAVFPAMVTFVLLIGFMFYLIFGMLQRMGDLAEDIDKMTGVIADALPVMQGGVVSMSSRMQWVGEDLKKMTADVNQMSNVLSKNMPSLTRSITGMTSDVSSMAYATNSMSATTHNMGQNVWDLNRSISGGPFGMMKDIMPFSKKTAPRQRSYYPYQQGMSNYYQPYAGSQMGTNMPAVAYAPAQQGVSALPPVVIASVGQPKYAGFCASCHGTTGTGGVGPNLSNHTSSTVVGVLKKYRSGELTGTMTGVAKEMTDHDIEIVAHFVENQL